MASAGYEKDVLDVPSYVLRLPWRNSQSMVAIAISEMIAPMLTLAGVVFCAVFCQVTIAVFRV